MRSRTLLASHWPLVATWVILGIVLALMLYVSVRTNDGHLVYALDDPYIHMAIAKSFSQSGVWGVTPEGFASSSSSLLWTLLLSLTYRVFGVHEVHALVLNVLCAMALVAYLSSLTRAHEQPPSLSFAVLASVVFLSPLPTLVFAGLEHVLQILIDLAFVRFSLAALQKERASPRCKLATVLLAPAVTGVRYEGMCLLMIVCLLLLARRRFAEGLAVGSLGLLPIVGYGLISWLQGWYFFPNPVVLEAGIPGTLGFWPLLLYLSRGARSIPVHPHLLVLAALSLALLLRHLRRSEYWTPPVLWNAVFVLATLLHLQLVGTGYFYRHEAYLVALGIVALAIGVPRSSWPPGRSTFARLPARLVAGLLAGLLAVPLVLRGFMAMRDAVLATNSIYRQQVQMGLFMRDSYPGSAVAANDIGAIGFLHEGPLLDLVGLATLPVARARMAGEYDAALMSELAERHQVKVAVLYETWFAETGIPDHWKKVGEWTIPRPVAAAHGTVSFYAVKEGEERRLIRNLRRFSSRLPDPVIERGEYTKPTL